MDDDDGGKTGKKNLPRLHDLFRAALYKVTLAASLAISVTVGINQSKEVSSWRQRRDAGLG